MSVSSENIEQLLKELNTAAEKGDVVEVERLLTIETVQQHMLTDENKILRAMAKYRYIEGIKGLLKFNLVQTNSFNSNSNRNAAILEAVDNCYLDVVKVLLPTMLMRMHAYRADIIPEQLTPNNLDMVKFLLTVPTVGKTLMEDCTARVLQRVIRQAIESGYLEIIEGMLQIKYVGVKLYDIFAHRMELKNYIQMAADLGHLAITYSLADNLMFTHSRTDFLKKNRQKQIPNIEDIPITIQGYPVSIANFLKNYQEQVLKEIEFLQQASNILKIHFPLALQDLIVDYLQLENIPDKFLQKKTVVHDFGISILTAILKMKQSVLDHDKEKAERATLAVIDIINNHSLSPEDIQDIHNKFHAAMNNPHLQGTVKSNISQRIVHCEMALAERFSNSASIMSISQPPIRLSLPHGKPSASTKPEMDSARRCFFCGY